MLIKEECKNLRNWTERRHRKQGNLILLGGEWGAGKNTYWLVYNELALIVLAMQSKHNSISTRLICISTKEEFKLLQLDLYYSFLVTVVCVHYLIADKVRN